MDKEYFVKSELAERWGVKRQAVNNWSNRHPDFPKPAFVLGNQYMPVYHVKDVERYERARKLKIKNQNEKGRD